MTPLIELRSVSKYFGSVIALNGVSFDVVAGEVHCLLGDNGAGKSTLIKTLSGVHTPDSGEILVAGRPARFGSPKETLDHGIATVYQDLALVPLMSVARNFFLGREPVKRIGFIRQLDIDYANRTAYRELRRMGIELRDAEQPVGTLSGGERQCLAIARAIHFGAKVLILDEPTSALGVHQASNVLRLIVQSKSNGIGVIFISHNVHHAYVVGDRFTILQRGKSVGTYGKDDISRDQLLNLMAGGKELVDLEAEIGRLPKSKREH
ncbi:MAG: ATP-binding cassette domain-containing protein [Mesorhizobium sp.]|jgi:simple sugar transport system ATP-binding protein